MAGAVGDAKVKRWGSVRAAFVFFAFTAPLGIVAHLTSELAGLGWQDDAEVAFSARHAYLAALALVSLAGLFLALRSVPPRDRRARIDELVSSLPFGGRGLGFTLASFVAQFGFFAVTQIGEGCPLCGGDVATGVLAAAVAAAIGAVAVALGKRRFIAFALACVYLSIATRRDESIARAFLRLRARRPRATRRTPFAFRYRPPPPRAEYAGHLTG
jgi:hypothetical protein